MSHNEISGELTITVHDSPKPLELMVNGLREIRSNSYVHNS